MDELLKNVNRVTFWDHQSNLRCGWQGGAKQTSSGLELGSWLMALLCGVCKFIPSLVWVSSECSHSPKTYTLDQPATLNCTQSSFNATLSHMQCFWLSFEKKRVHFHNANRCEWDQPHIPLPLHEPRKELGIKVH